MPIGVLIKIGKIRSQFTDGLKGLILADLTKMERFKISPKG